PDSLQEALNNKIQAQQQAEQQRYQLEQARVRAEQDKVEAQGRANALLVQAEAQAEANRKLAESVTEPLIRYQQIQKWDGKLPVFTGGATPLIDATGIISGTTQTAQP
ncbi:MAG: prohibitin family protein, partial [Chloroflexales bacterium]|nr:prohibitin family protein [Chloroflexales bacterium]